MAAENGQNGSEISKPHKRMRWATQKVGRTKSAARKRQSIMDRLHAKHGNEKKRNSDGSGSTNMTVPNDPNAEAEKVEDEEDESGERTIYFNRPLPPEAMDEEGTPRAKYARNKVRTAKYTPLSFVPKNLWFQFHNIANVYFLLLIVLGVGPSRSYRLPCIAADI
jgi:phospholipid-translocating ATPase